jgi:hypothetical protein
MEFLTVRGLTLHHSSTVTFWVKPHGYGALLSSSRRDEDLAKDWGMMFGINDQHARFTDKDTNTNIVTENPLEFYTWMHLAFTLEYGTGLAGAGATDINIYKNNAVAKYGSIDHIIVDYPDHTSLHMIGADESYGEYCEFFRGFLWSFKTYNLPLVDFGTEVSLTCRSCSACPTNQDCLGECNWNHYFDGGRCRRCPIWCV